MAILSCLIWVLLSSSLVLGEPNNSTQLNENIASANKANMEYFLTKEQMEANKKFEEEQNTSIVVGEFEFQRENGIIVIDEDNIENALKAFPVLVIEFYSPMCPHCRNFKPVYEKIQAILQTFGYKFVLAKADCIHNKGLIKEFGVKYFPFIQFFSHGIAKETFSGGRSTEKVIAWIFENHKMTPKPELVLFLESTSTILNDNTGKLSEFEGADFKQTNEGEITWTRLYAMVFFFLLIQMV